MINTKTKAQEISSLFKLVEETKHLPAEVAPVRAESQPGIENQVAQIVKGLIESPISETQAKQVYAKEVLNIGSEVQQKLVHASDLLKAPMQTLISELGDEGSITKDLLSLQQKIDDVNPNKFNFEMGALRRILSKIPGVGTVLSKWILKFTSVQSYINDLVNSLKSGRKKLERDNITLRTDKEEMSKLNVQLKQYIVFGQELDRQLSKNLDETDLDAELIDFLQKDVLFPLRQRVLDLQQQQAVNQNGVLTAETIIQNNAELVKGVDRTLNVTVVAFQTAATLSVALQHQRKVLDGVKAVNDTTNDLVLQTSKKLKEQGAEIQKSAMSASLDTKILKESFENVDAALKEINQFRLQALPKLSESIEEMTVINNSMQESINELETANRLIDDSQ